MNKPAIAHVPLLQHPLSAAFPPMTDEEYAALKEDIRCNGQREPILLYQGMVLDGFHRYLICNELRIKPLTFQYGGESPSNYVLSLNLHRRHLTPSQRALAVVACSEWAGRGGAKKVQRMAVPSASSRESAILPIHASVPQTVAEMAAVAGVSERTVGDAKLAVSAGLGDEVRAGNVSASQAANIVRGVDVPSKPPKPAKKPAREPMPHAALVVDAGVLAELEEKVAFLAAENDKLTDRISVLARLQAEATEDEQQAAQFHMDELRTRATALDAENQALKAGRDGAMQKMAEMERTIGALTRKVAKLEKEKAPA